jgi:hypothetical protein
MPYKDHAKNLACKRRYNKKYYKNNRDKERMRQKRTRLTAHGLELHRKSAARVRLRNPAKAIFNAAKQRSRKYGIPFTIEVSDVVIPERCPVLGIPLIFRVGHGKMQYDSPSLDRFIPAEGYVPGNIAVISCRANRLKSDGTPEEHEALARWMRAKRPCQ